MPDIGDGVYGFVGAILGALISGVITWYAAREQFERERKLREQEQREQHIYTALNLFTGGTQNRNVGISVIQQYLATMPDLIASFAPLFVNQAIYLLTESNSVKDLHEFNNLDRIMDLVFIAHNDRGSARPDPGLCHALDRRLGKIPRDAPDDWRRPDPDKSKGEKDLKGVEVDKGTLMTWRETFGCDQL